MVGCLLVLAISFETSAPKVTPMMVFVLYFNSVSLTIRTMIDEGMENQW